MKIQFNAVEMWAREFEKAGRTEPMDQEVVERAAEILEYENLINQDAKLKEEFESETHNAFALVVYKRAKALCAYRLDLAATLMIESVTENFGDATMICAYLQYLSFRDKTDNITARYVWDNIILRMPDKNKRSELWKMQKIDPEERKDYFFSDNVLDYPKAYESIKNRKERPDIRGNVTL